MTKVKKSVVNRRSLFPVGAFRGEVTGPSGDQGYRQQNDDGTFGSLNFQLTNNSLVEGDTEPGARRLFIRIPLWQEVEVEGKRGKKDTKVWETVDVANDEDLQEDDNVPFGIRDAVGTLAQLAAQLGVAQVTDEGVEDFDAGDFISEIEDGKFEGETVEFAVKHRFSKKAGRSFEQVDFVVPDAEEGESQPASQGSEEEEEEEPETEDEPEEKPASAKRGSGRSKFKRKK